jgi:hypothetical protein
MTLLETEIVAVVVVVVMKMTLMTDLCPVVLS